MGPLSNNLQGDIGDQVEEADEQLVETHAAVVDGAKLLPKTPAPSSSTQTTKTVFRN